MKITLTAEIIKEPGDNGYTGWINEISGVIAYGKTVDEAKKELIRMLGIKLKVDGERRKNYKRDDNLISEELTFSAD